ncbi:hypothetical protein D9619_012184 [Psilocybe cf. subviscida]|uniref:F-box domain-containing protein n=1 Tax=Psilocybe cf. subviscida TaxID=2480587 RepID=A0A8H5B787_9AGAR|nr:hypothetical protein D9619_012184 [Psilocybe cf. subviscida]
MSTCSSVPSGSSSQPPCSSKTPGARCNGCKNLAELDAKIADARQSLLAMQARRYEILSDLNVTHDSLVERFPLEIIANIFRQCLPDLETLSRSNNRRLTNVPLHLSQVCRRWRIISHSLHSLWNIMALYVKESQLSSFQNICEVARKWITHSGDLLPLHIILKVDPKAESKEGRFRTIFEATTNHEQRLAYLQINTSKTVLQRLQALGGDLSPLHVLPRWSMPTHIIYLSRKSISSSSAPFGSKTLRMKRILLENIEISLSNLTRVETNHIYFGDVISLLCHARTSFLVSSWESSMAVIQTVIRCHAFPVRL